MRNHKTFGKEGELSAARFLKKKGYSILETNYRYERYEIDIIAETGSTIIFVEVKTAKDRTFGYPEERVDSVKQKKISIAAQAYIDQHHLEDYDYRFDVISIIQNSQKREITHIEDAFWMA